MNWLEVSVPANGDIDALCETLEALGAGGVVIEDEADFQRFFSENQKYWDFVDEDLAARFRGVSRVKFYLADDAAGRAALETVRLGDVVTVIHESDGFEVTARVTRYQYNPLTKGASWISVGAPCREE